MTAKEYLDKIRDINERSCALTKEKRQVMKEYVDSLPFKVDDYICIIDCDYSTEEVWIAAIEPITYCSDRVNLYVNRHNKNGSRSKIEMKYVNIKIKDVRVIKQ